MKLTSDSLLTSADLLKEFFGMNKKIINNLSEKRRYEKIYEYLAEKQTARKLGRREDNNQSYTTFIWRGDVYLIPENIFDELDSQWQEEITTEQEEARLS